MNTQNVNVQVHTQQSTAKGAVYYPFSNGEIVTDVMFSEPTNYKIKVVEGFKSIADGEANSVNLGMQKTVCLVVETTKEVSVKVYTKNH